MGIIARIIAVLNIIYLLGILLIIFTMMNAILAVLGTSLGLLLLFIIPVWGSINSILYFMKNRSQNVESSKLDTALSIFPLVNISLISIAFI